jgi:hypothetical protein
VSEKIETMKCYNPNNELPMCRECTRNSTSSSNEYEYFNLIKTLMNGWQCDGFSNGIDDDFKGSFYD